MFCGDTHGDSSVVVRVETTAHRAAVAASACRGLFSSTRPGGRKESSQAATGRCSAARDGASGSVLCVPMTFTVFVPVLRNETCHVFTFADFYCGRKKLKAVSQVEMARNPARKLYRARNRDFLSPEIKRPPCIFDPYPQLGHRDLVRERVG